MELFRKYFTLSETQNQQFAALQEIYAYWNERINVVSRKDMENLYERHVLHSLGIAKMIQFRDNSSILDVGTGGGFPGIPLAIMFPSSNFVLVDSIGKKITVVKAVAEALGLKNVEALQTRAEMVDGKFDFVVSRAVTTLPQFYPWVKNKIKPTGFNQMRNGILYLKGGDVQKEVEQLIKTSRQSAVGSRQSPLAYKIFELSDYFEEEFFATKKVVYIGNSK
jgi:16S rRNA (guanine527-N7)-methyltransferase